MSSVAENETLAAAKRAVHFTCNTTELHTVDLKKHVTATLGPSSAQPATQTNTNT
jgi:hypothetical protein